MQVDARHAKPRTEISKLQPPAAASIPAEHEANLLARAHIEESDACSPQENSELRAKKFTFENRVQ